MDDDQMSQDQHFAMDLVAGNQRQETNERLAAIEEHLAAQQARIVSQCPFCDGDLTKVNVEICKTCGKELAWFDGIVYKPGESEKQRVMALAADRSEERRLMKEKLNSLYEEKQKLEPVQKKVLTLMCGGVGIGLICGFIYAGIDGDGGDPPGFLLFLSVVSGVGGLVLAIVISKNAGLNKLEKIKEDIEYFESQRR